MRKLHTFIRSLVEVCRSLEEKAWNINIEASDMVYTDSAEFKETDEAKIEE